MRYGEFVAKHKIRHTELSYNLLTPKPDPSGEKSLRPAPIQITPSRAAALLGPYVGVRITEQLKAVVPLAAYLMIFQLLVLNYPIQDAFSLFVGLVAVIVGLAVFMEGLNVGLMPFGTIIGDNLPKKPACLLFSSLLASLGWA